MRWSELPKVLFPDATTGTCFSGAAFIDHRDQLGRKSGAEEVIVAFYLRTEIGLCLAWSNDRGRTFTDYEHNPVLNHEGARIDTPRPFWHEPTARWVAPTYDFFTNRRGELRSGRVLRHHDLALTCARSMAWYACESCWTALPSRSTPTTAASTSPASCSRITTTAPSP